MLSLILFIMDFIQDLFHQWISLNKDLLLLQHVNKTLVLEYGIIIQ